MILVLIYWTDKRLDSRMSVSGPLAHLRSGVSLQDRWAKSVGGVCASLFLLCLEVY